MAEPAADPDRFDAAVDAFRKRVPVDREAWDLLTTQQRERAFTVSRVTEGRVLQSTLDAIDRAVAEGGTLQEFKDSVAADLIEAWGGEIPGRLETIFRTNVMTAYGEGRHAIMSSPTVKQARPYWRFDDAETDRECDLCSECGGTTLPVDDPWWETHSPPLHFSCECKKTPLSREEAEEEGIDSKGPGIDADEGFGAEPSQDGTNWDFDLSGMDPELRKIVEDSLKGEPRERPEPAEKPERVERSPEREPEPAPREPTKNLETAVQEGDLHGATLKIVDDMQKNGMHVWAKDPKVSEVDFGGYELDRMQGTTDPNGHIRVDKEVAAAASRFVKALSEDRVGTLNGVNRILRQRAREIDPRDWTDYTDAHGELAKDVRGLEAVVHEAHHLAGPQGTGMLGAEARALNEITTEMAARKYMRERIGVRYPVQNDHLFNASGYYGDLTEGMRNAIKDVMKVDNETANAMLENASVRFKSRRDLLTEGPQVRKLFAEAFGSMKKEIEDAIHRIDFE